IVRMIKSLTAREIFKRVPTVKKQLWGGEFWSKGSFISTVGRHGNEEAIRQYELVASFVNRSNLLKSWEKTDPCAVSTSGAHGPKNTAITRIPAHALPRSRTPFSDRTALV